MKQYLLGTNNTRYNYLLVCAIGMVIMSLVFLEYRVQTQTNEKNYDRSATLLLESIASFMDNNEQERLQMVEEAKSDCIDRARTVARLLEQSGGMNMETNGLREIAAFMRVDEIHIFSPEGIIVNGTVEKYFGLSMKSGKQISFFLPMLENKNNTMCQNVTPNTAENKKMMYAMVWNEAGTAMVQVGIAPKRLKERLQKTEFNYVLRMMPVLEGMNIFVASQQTGELYGSTTDISQFTEISQLGIGLPELTFDGIRTGGLERDGVKYRYSLRCEGPYLIGVLQDTQLIHQGLGITLLMVLMYLVLAAIALVTVVRYLRARLLQGDRERERQNNILRKMAEIYYSIHLVNLDTDMAEELYAFPDIHNNIDLSRPVSGQISRLMTMLINPAHLDRMMRFIDLSTVAERMRERNSIYEDFLGRKVWIRASFVVIERHADGTPRVVAFRTLDVDKEKQRELKLLLSSTTDGLTGCLNRHAYDMELEKYELEPLPENFVSVLLDVNGLKVVNDTLGHMAGDELICGAADIIRASFQPFGRVYRVGGDEFIALIEADREQLQVIRDDFSLLQQEWRGRQVKEIHISLGCAPSYELPGLNAIELGKEADTRMYEDKSAFYRSRGVDRRGRQRAKLALCETYLKILQGNLTEDSYLIVNMLEEEKSSRYGFRPGLSRWLQAFGNAGQVHPEDLQAYLEQTSLSYLREYFRQGNNRLGLIYRRRRGESFQRVLMEIVAGKEYRDDNQEIYIFVKNIDV